MRAPTANIRTLLVAAAALLALLVTVVVRAGHGAGEPVRFLEDDLEIIDVAELELARVERTQPIVPTPLRVAAPGSAERAALSVRGRVVASGRPLDGASVRLELRTDGGRAGRLVRIRRPAITGSDGSFAIDGVAPIARHAVLEVRHPGFAPAVLEVALDADRPRIDVGEIPMSIGGGITGRITDSGGAPIRGATVSARPAGGNPLDRASRWEELLAPRTTGADGAFAFERLPAGAYRVEAIAADRQRAALAELVQVIDREVRDIGALPLPQGFAIIGAVTDAVGQPIGGAEVRLQDRPGVDEMPRVREVVRADDHGRFRSDHLPRRRLIIDVAADGFLSRRVDATATDDGATIVVELADGLSIEGSVRARRSDAPVTRFAIAARTADPSHDAVDGFEPLRVPTGVGDAADHPDGAFRIDGLDAGWYRVEVVAPGLGFARSDAFELAPGVPTPRLALTIETAAAIEGTARAARDGRPLEGVRITVLGPRDLTADPPPISVVPAEAAAAPAPVLAAARTGADGAFRIEHLAAGRYLLVAESERFIPVEIEVDAGREGLELELTEPATLFGSVSGADPATAQVLVYGGPRALHGARVAADGSYRIDGLGPGGYLVRAFVGDARDALLSRVRAATDRLGAPLQVDVVLEPGESRELALDARPPVLGSVGGRILENGEPATACEVNLRIDTRGGEPRWIGRRLAVETASDGSFALLDVPIGRYSLVVEHRTAGRPEIHREDVVVRDGARAIVEVQAQTGALDIRVTATDSRASDQLTGQVRLISGGASTASLVDATHGVGRARHAPLRDGRASFEHAPAGAAIVVVEVRGRARVAQAVAVPTGGARTTVTIDAGARAADGR